MDTHTHTQTHTPSLLQAEQAQVSVSPAPGQPGGPALDSLCSVLYQQLQTSTQRFQTRSKEREGSLHPACWLMYLLYRYTASLCQMVPSLPDSPEDLKSGSAELLSVFFGTQPMQEHRSIPSPCRTLYLPLLNFAEPNLHAHT